jgi:hypothetical protein
MSCHHPGEFEQVVLPSVPRLGDEAYGVPIRTEIEPRAGRPVSVGALYATLDRLAAIDLCTRGLPIRRPSAAVGRSAFSGCGPRVWKALAEFKAVFDRMWNGIRLPGRSRV